MHLKVETKYRYLIHTHLSYGLPKNKKIYNMKNQQYKKSNKENVRIQQSLLPPMNVP